MPKLEFDYFDHDADIGIIGRGATIELAFVNAADSMFAIMADIKNIKATNEIHINFVEDDTEFALVEWLNLLLTKAREEGLMLGQFELTKKNSRWIGKAYGESWQSSFEHGVEVKGATLTMLSVKQDEFGWEVRCVVDV